MSYKLFQKQICKLPLIFHNKQFPEATWQKCNVLKSINIYVYINKNGVLPTIFL